MRLESPGELADATAHGAVEVGADGMALLQEYVAPAGQETFRVWVAGGEVQCGVRIWHSQPGDFGGCMSAACRVGQSQRSVHAWAVPPGVAASVLAVMASCGADCGSVEFLYPEGQLAPEPLFFDVNMLSTLPLPGSFVDQAGVWPPGMDPWDDLARFILREAERQRAAAKAPQQSP